MDNDPDPDGGTGAPNGSTAAGLDDLPELPIEELAARITSLSEAFRRCERQTGHLNVEVVGRVSGSEDLVHPVAGFSARLERQGAGGVALYVSAGYGELTRWRGPGLTEAGAQRERFRVRLLEEYAWGDTVFPNADELAQALVGYMHYRLESPV